MSVWLWMIVMLLGCAVGGFALRAGGQAATGNAPQFRDMPFGVAFGYVLGALLLILSVFYFFQPKVTEAGIPNAGVVFFRWAVQGLLIGAAAAWAFKQFGKYVGTAWSRKLFRSMPLTASFGILVILIYSFVAVFAQWIAPYGQEEILGAANVIPGGDPALGGDPTYPLGTDQIGRDMKKN